MGAVGRSFGEPLVVCVYGRKGSGQAPELDGATEDMPELDVGQRETVKGEEGLAGELLLGDGQLGLEGGHRAGNRGWVLILRRGAGSCGQKSVGP